MTREGKGLILLGEKIERMVRGNKQIILAIDGPCGSGKSSLARRLSQLYEANVFHLDDYFLTPELRTDRRLEEPGGNVDYERFYQEIILGIESKKSFSYFKYNCKSNTKEQIDVEGSKKLNVIEGSYSLHPYLRDSYDIKVFLTVEPEVQRQRILLRNGEEMALRFFNEWIPLENFYFKELSIENKADIVIDGTTEELQNQSLT